jgi:hypothetical protein
LRDGKIMTRGDIEHELDAQSRASRARTRQIIAETGRLDVLADYDKNMRDLDLGITGARSTWAALSSKQRFVLRALGVGRYLSRSLRSTAQYDALGRGAVLDICRLSTARVLCAHGLIHVNGGATDPEAQFVITERGHFVLRYGMTE